MSWMHNRGNDLPLVRESHARCLDLKKQRATMWSPFDDPVLYCSNLLQ